MSKRKFEEEEKRLLKERFGGRKYEDLNKDERQEYDEIVAFYKKKMENIDKQQEVTEASRGVTSKSKLTLRHEQLVRIILFLQDWPCKPPGGGRYAWDIFEALNPEAFDLLARFSAEVDAEAEVHNLRLSAQEFTRSSIKSVAELLNERFTACSVVCQPGAVMVPSSKSHQFLLCSFFHSKPAIVVLEPGNSFDLE